MAFSKLYTVVQDSPLGYQTVNQMADNQADLRTQLLVQHGYSDPNAFTGIGKVIGGTPAAPPDFHLLGRHDMTEVPRGVAQTLVFSQFAGFGVFSSGLSWTGPGIASVQWLSTGVYFLPIVGLSTFRAKVTPLVAVGVTAIEPVVRQMFASTLNGPLTGLRVALFKLSAGDFVPDDQPFTISLYGDP